MNPSKHPLDCAAFIVGGRATLADQLSVTVAAIGNWKVRGVPIEHCPTIERLTGAKVRRQQLRPTDWQVLWPELVKPDTASTLPNGQHEQQDHALVKAVANV